MRAVIVKKIRKELRKRNQVNWKEYVDAICQWPFRHRLRFARHILSYKKGGIMSWFEFAVMVGMLVALGLISWAVLIIKGVL